MPHRVLVVDDDLIMHEVLQRYLGRNGYEMINACNGREAIALATRELPELIILDVMMPEMGGCPPSANSRKQKLPKRFL